MPTTVPANGTKAAASGAPFIASPPQQIPSQNRGDAKADVVAALVRSIVAKQRAVFLRLQSWPAAEPRLELEAQGRRSGEGDASWRPVCRARSSI
jgi:hypothetical protein